MESHDKNTCNASFSLHLKDGKRKPLLLFDFGCVIIDLDKRRCIDALEKVGCGAIARYVDEHRSEDLFHEIELGGSIENFCNEAREKSSCTDENGTRRDCKATDEEICWAWNELLTGISTEKLRLIKHLHDDLGFRTAILSNTNWIHWRISVEKYFTADGCTVDDYFDHVFLSCDLRMIKPDAEIYHHVTKVTGYNAEDIIFFDDSARNCEGARACGINAIHDPKGNAWIGMIRQALATKTGRVAAIGNFDGVHKGHIHILETLRSVAEEKSLEPTVITFDRHPRTIFDPTFSPKFLTTTEEKTRLIRKYIEEVTVLSFSKSLANMPARDFMEHYMRDEMGIKTLLLGYDNRFGKRNDRENYESYLQYGKELGIEVLLADPIDVDGTRVSSSLVRQTVAEGRMEEAARYMGRQYSITGTVTEGHKEGRRIGFPTANIMPPEDKLLPPNGVYAVAVTIEHGESQGGTSKYRGMTNIGTRPTYHDKKDGNKVTVETNIFDFNGEIYGKEITIEFLRKIRDEKTFDSPEALKAQIGRDKEIIMGL